MTYPVFYRPRVLNYHFRQGMSIRGVADHFYLSPTTVMRWKKRLEPMKTRNKLAVKIQDEMLGTIRMLINTNAQNDWG